MLDFELSLYQIMIIEMKRILNRKFEYLKMNEDNPIGEGMVNSLLANLPIRNILITMIIILYKDYNDIHIWSTT